MKNLLIAGGDRRALLLAELLNEDGFAVQTVGLKAGDEETFCPEMAHALLLPYPFSVKNGRIPTMTDVHITPNEIITKLPQDACILAGSGVETSMLFETQKMKHYADADGFAEANAEISAEAGVFEAMLRSQRTLQGLRMLVTGYGLFGRALAKKLAALGAQVWVAVRREEQRTQAEKDGMNAVLLVQLREILPQMEMVINTVPAHILNEDLLKLIPSNCPVLEMASAPYGFDIEQARAMGLSVAVLPSLPAAYAPLSAAQVLKRAALELLRGCSV